MRCSTGRWHFEVIFHTNIIIHSILLLILNITVSIMIA